MTDWTALDTAEGSATSVPRWIAELSAESLPQRDEALLSLFARLVRDGVTYSAAPAALDALAPLSDALGDHGHRSLWLVGDIFAAGHLARIRGVSAPSPARQAVLDRGEAWRAIAEKAARQPDEAWRAAAAFALAFVPGKEHALVLELAQNDPSIPVRVCALFACGWLARSDDAMVRALDATPEDERLADAVRIARAIAAPERTSEATEALVRWLLSSPASSRRASPAAENAAAACMSSRSSPTQGAIARILHGARAPLRLLLPASSCCSPDRAPLRRRVRPPAPRCRPRCPSRAPRRTLRHARASPHALDRAKIFRPRAPPQPTGPIRTHPRHQIPASKPLTATHRPHDLRLRSSGGP